MHIQSLIQAKKTLIIACHQNEVDAKRNWQNTIYMFDSPGNALHQHPYLYQEQLRYYLEVKGCAQILLIGHIHHDAIDQLLRSTALHSPASTLTFKSHLFCMARKHILENQVLQKALIEANVIQQCQVLMEYDFIQSLVERKSIALVGVVAATDQQQALPVFYNGIAYNYYAACN